MGGWVREVWADPCRLKDSASTAAQEALSSLGHLGFSIHFVESRVGQSDQGVTATQAVRRPKPRLWLSEEPRSQGPPLLCSPAPHTLKPPPGGLDSRPPTSVPHGLTQCGQTEQLEDPHATEAVGHVRLLLGFCNGLGLGPPPWGPGCAPGGCLQ